MSEVIDWLLDSDPTLRWQVQRDLAGEPEEVWQATRARIATEGDGARLLSHQDPDGQWAGGAYFPRDAQHTHDENAEPGQPWTATTWTLTTLREWGMDAGALAGTADKLKVNARWEYDDLPYWDGEVDVCINAMTLANGAWLGADVSKIAAWFPEHLLDDGGWDCEWVEGSTRSSFHSTINALRGILSYEKTTGDTSLRDARHSGEEYLLTRRLRYRLSAGEPVGDWVNLLAYPYRWVYSALMAVDYFTEAAEHDGVAPDPRAEEMIEHVRAKRQPDGRWIQGYWHEGREWFPLDVRAGEPSKWVTLIAQRALNRWDAG